jgi:acylpyruvate hydrolase
MIERGADTVPALCLDDAQLVDLKAVQAAGIAGLEVPSSLMEIIDLRKDFLQRLRSFLELMYPSSATLEAVREVGAILNPREVRFANLLRPGMILSAGKSYADHVSEMSVGDRARVAAILEEPPPAFIKANGSLTCHGRPILLPALDPETVDFECEFSCVIGRPFHHVEPDEILGHIAGYTMVNDVSVRSAIPEMKAAESGTDPARYVAYYNLNLLNKQYPTFCPLGPVLATADDFGDPHDVHIETKLNGVVMQSAKTSGLTHTIAQMLAHYSRWYRFEVGDVFTTGTPSGIGFARSPKIFLRPGDTVEVSGERIGTLSNPVERCASN